MGSTICLPQIPAGSDEYLSKKEFLDACQTGDIVFWSGNSGESFTVRLCGMEEIWSHVGVVYIDPSGRKCLFESVRGYDPIDTFTGTRKDGPRLSDLKDKLDKYHGFFVALIKLYMEDQRRLHEQLPDIIDSLIDDVYSQNPLELLSGVHRNNQYDSQGLSCIEALATVFIQLGVLKRGARQPNNYKLSDFTYDYRDLPYVDWKRARFGREKYLRL